MAIDSISYLSLAIMTIGIASLIVGVTLYEVNVGTSESLSPWIWTLILGGIILSLGGSLFSIILLSRPEPNYL